MLARGARHPCLTYSCRVDKASFVFFSTEVRMSSLSAPLELCISAPGHIHYTVMTLKKHYVKAMQNFNFFLLVSLVFTPRSFQWSDVCVNVKTAKGKNTFLGPFVNIFPDDCSICTTDGKLKSRYFASVWRKDDDMPPGSRFIRPRCS